jgi:lysozyme
MINKAAELLIKRFESLHDGDLTEIGIQPKMDPVGIWTEGWGRAMRGDNGQFLRGKVNKDLAYKLATVNTEEEADAAFLEDIKTYELIVSKKIRVPLNDNQYGALVSYTYNTGGSSTLFRLINVGAADSSIRKWMESKYITAGGNRLLGLVRRRKAEADLYFTKVK